MKSRTQDLRALGWVAGGTCLLLSLGGCASMVESMARTQDTGLLNPDSVQGERRTRREKAGGPSAQHGENPHQQAATRLRGSMAVPCGGESGGQAAEFTFLCRQHKAEQAEVDTSQSESRSRLARQYLSAGLTLSNELCDAWFTRLQVAQVTLRQSSDVMSSVGAVSAAIMGATNTTPKTIGLTAAMFGAGKQANDNLTNNYIVAPDLTAVSAAVREFRSLYAAEIEQAPESSWNYYNARRVLMAYDNTCTALFVRRFINNRVQGGTENSDPLLETALTAFASKTSRYFGKPVSVAHLIDVYALLLLPDVASPVRDKLIERLKQDGVMTASGELFASGITVDEFQNGLVLNNVSAALRERSLQRVQALEEAVQAEAAQAEKEANEAVKQADQKTNTAINAESDAAAAASMAAQAAALAAKSQAELDVADADRRPTLLSAAQTAAARAVAAEVEQRRLSERARGLRNEAELARSAAQAQTDRARRLSLPKATRLIGERAPVPRAPDGRPLDTPPAP